MPSRPGTTSPLATLQQKAKLLHRWNSGASSIGSAATTGSSWVESEEQRSVGLRDFELDEDEEERPLVPPPTADYGDLFFGVPTGPLRFIEANWFQLLVGSAILVNVSTVVAEEIDEKLQEEFWSADQFFLTFYCIELLLRIGHFRKRFFAASWDEPWNYLDLAIVVMGVLDQWVLPAMNAGGQSDFFRLVRALRLLRLLRVVRLFRVWLTADFSWTESGWFQSLVGTVIALNAVIIGFETDIKSPAWWWIEQGLLVFFVFELLFRLKLTGITVFFTDPDDCWWNMLDFLIVISGVVDQWVMQVWYFFMPTAGGHGNIGQMMLLMRMLRLMRILRLVRVIRSVRPLYNLALGITRAMQMMVWVLVLMFLALYMLAILLTRLVGDGISVDRDSLPPETVELFDSVLASMFTLFAVMNGQEWSRIMPLIEQAPWTRPVLVIFTIYCSWALLSVMTGVVSDHMEEVRKSLEQQDEELREERREQMQVALAQVFSAADIDGTGTLDRKEYMRIMASPFHVHRLQSSMGHASAFEQIFDWLDVDDDGRVGFQELSDSLDWLSETVTGRQLMKIYQSLKLSHRDVLKSVSDTEESRQNLHCCHIAQHADLMRTMGDALELTEVEVARSKSPFALARVPSASSSGLQSSCGVFSPVGPHGLGDRPRPILRRGGSESSTFSAHTAHTPSGVPCGGNRPKLAHGMSGTSMGSSGSHLGPRGILKHSS